MKSARCTGSGSGRIQTVQELEEIAAFQSAFQRKPQFIKRNTHKAILHRVTIFLKDKAKNVRLTGGICFNTRRPKKNQNLTRFQTWRFVLFGHKWKETNKRMMKNVSEIARMARTVFLESEKSQKSQGEGEGEGKGKGEGKEYIKKDTLYREGSRHSREKTLRSGVVYKHKTKDLLHEPTKAVSRSVFCFERVCFIIRCFAVYFVFLLTDGKRHAKHINSLIWPNFGVFLSILG